MAIGRCVPAGSAAVKAVTEFSQARSQGQRITLVTAYDHWSARLVADSPIDAILVGDSVAMVVHGFDSTVHATVGMMASHTAAVRRGAGDKFIIADVPFPHHRKGIDAAMDCVDALMKAGANAVKIEGAAGHTDVIAHIVGSGVPVMGHLGLTPQSVHQLGGYRVQGRDDESARRIVDDARALQRAGCFALVLECVPAPLAAEITEQLAIPTIGIGSGAGCSGQVLVLQDLLGLNRDFKPKFVRTYMDGAQLIGDALAAWAADVREHRFPADKENFR